MRQAARANQASRATGKSEKNSASNAAKNTAQKATAPKAKAPKVKARATGAKKPTKAKAHKSAARRSLLTETEEFSGLGQGRVLPRLGLFVVALSITVGLLTLAILTGLTPIQPDGRIVLSLEIINAVLVFAMIGVIAWQGARMWRARRRGIAGARLHVRLVTLFSLVAAIPAIIVIAFASVTLDRGLNEMFAKSTRTIVDNALLVAESYIRSYSPLMEKEMKALVDALAHPDVRKTYQTDKQNFPKLLNTLRALSSFHVVYLVNNDGKPLVAAADRRNRPRPPPPPPSAVERAKAGKMSVLSSSEGNLVLGVIKLKGYQNTFLHGYRFIDPQIVANLNNARVARAQYSELEGRRKELLVTFALISTSVALVFLLAAIWLGLTVADRLVAPIVRLMDAARRVSRGKLNVKVPVNRSEGDLKALSSTFNKMTSQLQSQHAELTDTNAMLTERRRFIEAVLSGVTSGVIGLDQRGRITLVNQSAQNLLDIEEARLMGKPIARVLPEFQNVFAQATERVASHAEAQITHRKGEVERNLVVRVMAERHGREKDFGYVLTFDDTTELVTAQRSAAWADIARRIAHEIKNPLTPIQLSAERLRRRYGEKIEDDRGIFDQCTQTIIRQVGDIGRMVDEFSSFARMPKANLEKADLVAAVKEGVLLQRVGHEHLKFDLDLPDKPVTLEFDRRLVNQAITNLVKNAGEAIEARIAKTPDHKGRIMLKVTARPDMVMLDIIDNGIGLPSENRAKLLEPYITTREKGTGLGLAIVRKIMEEHRGKLLLRDAPGLENGAAGAAGAMMRLVFPRKAAKTPRSKAPQDMTADAGDKAPQAKPAKAARKRKTKSRSKSTRVRERADVS